MEPENQDQLDEARELLDRRSTDALANAIEHMASALTDQVQETRRSNEVATALVKATSDRSAQLTAFATDQTAIAQRAQRRFYWTVLVGVVLIGSLLWVGTLNRITNQTVLDCVRESNDPQSCYQKQQKNAASVVASIVDTDKDGKPDSQEQEALLEQILEVLGSRSNP